MPDKSPEKSKTSDMMITEKVSIRSSKNYTIRALFRGQAEGSQANISKTLLIMAHGFPSHKAAYNNLFGDLESLLTEKGFHTLRFDFGGCGESDGKEENFTIGNALEDLKTIKAWAKKNGYKDFILIGEGLGGTISAMSTDMNVKALVLLWPALDLQEFSKSVFAGKKITAADRKKGYTEQDGHRIGLNFLGELEKVKMTKYLKAVRSPTLIMHGAEDKKVPVTQLDHARRHINAKRVEITTFHDGDHGLQKMNHRKTMFYHISQFIEKYA